MAAPGSARPRLSGLWLAVQEPAILEQEGRNAVAPATSALTLAAAEDNDPPRTAATVPLKSAGTAGPPTTGVHGNGAQTATRESSNPRSLAWLHSRRAVLDLGLVLVDTFAFTARLPSAEEVQEEEEENIEPGGSDDGRPGAVDIAAVDSRDEAEAEKDKHIARRSRNDRHAEPSSTATSTGDKDGGDSP